MRNPSAVDRSRLVVWWMLAWVPFAILWGVFTVISFDVAPGPALVAGMNTMGWAAVLGIGVWWLTGRVGWPVRLGPVFYVTHLVAGSAFSALWLLTSNATGLVLDGEPLTELPAAVRPFLEWRALTGFWLYGLIAGVGYAVRHREAMEAQRQAAERAERLAVQAQLDSLRARLNPHFFFNTLNALSGLIHRDPAEADDALDRIGRLLRRVLAADPGGAVPVADEWAFTEEYLDLERLRFGDRLRIEADIAPDAAKCLVPAFTLQPLVENAVVHGVSPKIDPAVIRVEATQTDGRLQLRVCDDGPGIASPSSEGQGLDLLRRRLDALYGEKARVTLREAPGGGAEAVVELPAERNL